MNWGTTIQRKVQSGNYYQKKAQDQHQFRVIRSWAQRGKRGITLTVRIKILAASSFVRGQESKYTFYPFVKQFSCLSAIFLALLLPLLSWPMANQDQAQKWGAASPVTGGEWFAGRYHCAVQHDLQEFASCNTQPVPVWSDRCRSLGSTTKSCGPNLSTRRNLCSESLFMSQKHKSQTKREKSGADTINLHFSECLRISTIEIRAIYCQKLSLFQWQP